MKKNVFRAILAVVLVATVVVFTVSVGAVTAAHYKEEHMRAAAEESLVTLSSRSK